MSTSRSEPRRRGAPAAGLAAALALLCIYLGTIAPTVTLWDAGEFVAAARSLGVPHPPGTPLYVFAAHVWGDALPWLDPALATSLLSAVCTAAACGVLASLVARWTRDRVAGAASGIAAGAMSAVWLSANETEVYAASLLLSSAMLLVGDRAGRRDDGRAVVLLAYLIGLAIPLHLGATVAAPAAIVLAAWPVEQGRARLQSALLLSGITLVVAGTASASWPLAAPGLALLAASPFVHDGDRSRRPVLPLAALAAAALGASAVALMYVRARHDPAVNQGDPSTLVRLWEVVTRQQYDVPGLWPRRAPLWLQLGNVAQWADWQVALGLDRAVGPSVLRTPFTFAWVALAVAGGAEHIRRERRSGLATGLLLAAASVGVVLLLNLRAGPSYGWGVLPDGADREPRERDYFFALAFAVWGAWAALGAVSLARRHSRSTQVTLAAAALVALAPVALNWRAVDRLRAPERGLAPAIARALLETAPEGAVVLAAGDNDSYPLWYAQQARGRRTDVTVVTTPMLGARWYRAELGRRWDLYDPSRLDAWRGTAEEVLHIARRAVAGGRPLAASVAFEADLRRRLGGGWTFTGYHFLWDPGGDPGRVAIDTAAVARARALAATLRAPLDPAGLADPTARYLAVLLSCPRLAVEVEPSQPADGAPAGQLDSRCNLR